jgi:hypothetical protein
MSDSRAATNSRWEQLLAEFDNRRDEAYAAAVVEYVLQARVERRDLPVAERGTVDAEVIYPDGRTAALEVTSVEASSTWHLRARLDRMRPTTAPGQLMWVIRPNSIVELDRLVKIHRRVIAVCEQHGAQDPESLPYDVIAADPDLTWLAWEDAQGGMSGHEVPGNPRIFWEQPIEVAVFSSEGEAIAAGVAAELTVEPSVGHIAKLLRDSHEERHLFLIIGATGLGTAAAFSLIGAEEVPNADPDLPPGVDHLWLGPGWGETATVWTRGHGWRNVRVRDQPDAEEEEPADP